MVRRFALVAVLLLSACARTALSTDTGCAAGARVACEGERFVDCERAAPPVDCAMDGRSCHPTLGCVACEPGEVRCDEDVVVRCADDGSRWEAVEECRVEEGALCRDAECVDACALAREAPSHLGCEHWAVDLDLSEPDRALEPSQTLGITVGNPNLAPVRVVIERNDAAPGDPPIIVEEVAVVVPPLDYETIPLPDRPVDRPPGGEETHSALTSHAYRLRSTLPVTLVQSNPLSSEDHFSGDTSLLYPTELLGTRTTVVGWPQTIAHDPDPLRDFDSTREDEDLRAFLTVVGVAPSTRVRIILGPLGEPPVEVVAGPGVPSLGPGAVLDVMLGEFDVLNLETRGYLADFTGSVVESDQPVAVFIGSEASDVPAADTVRTRICCADHLEEQLLPDDFGGRRFVVGRQPPRRPAVARARGAGFVPIDEPEWIRVVAIDDVELETTAELPRTLRATEHATARLNGSTEIQVLQGGPIHVLSALMGQDGLGVTSELPGGDPSILLVMPTDSYQRRSSVVVPVGSLFDFVTVVAERDARLRFDGLALDQLVLPGGGAACDVEPAGPSFVAHRCQLSFPRVDRALVAVDRGTQDDGLHLVEGDRPFTVTVSGFHRYISYAHPGAFRAF